MLKKNDEVELLIEDFNSEGAGVAHVGETGYTLFVKGAAAGDRILARVVKTKKSYGFARLLRILSPSKDRVRPLCAHAGRCGGCQLQHVSYSRQLAWKEQKIQNCLRRIGGFGEAVIEKMEPMLAMEVPFFYRNKAQFPVGENKDGSLAIGFYAGHSHRIIDCRHCSLQSETNPQILETVRSFLETYGIPPYHEENHTGLVRHILTRTAFCTGEQMVCLVLNGESLPHAEQLVEALSAVAGMKSISININTERTNVILGDRTKLLWGTPYITDDIGGIAFQISPQSFYQVNPLQTERLYRTALEYAGLTGKEVVWDLYCGIGTISLFLAGKARQVYGVEIVPQAVEDAKRNAALNRISNAEFFTGAAEDFVNWKSLPNPDVIVVDPPRKGCDRRLLDAVLKAAPARLVYISCDPATLARDLKVLCGGRYGIERWRGCDMFGQTCHVETIVGLQRRDM